MTTAHLFFFVIGRVLTRLDRNMSISIEVAMEVARKILSVPGYSFIEVHLGEGSPVEGEEATNN